MRHIKVTFSRVYEVDWTYIEERLDPEELYDEQRVKNAAEDIAREWLSDEMSEYIDRDMDFVSAKVEIMGE